MDVTRAGSADDGVLDARALSLDGAGREAGEEDVAVREAVGSSPSDAGPSRSDTGLVRNTESGPVRGVEHRGTVQWRGIPYAAAPVGPLRWRVPHPAASWQEIRDCSGYGPAAPQMVTDPVGGVGPDDAMSEDCLYVNVVAPAGGGEGDARPVVVFVHGGAFIMGAGSAAMYRGTAFARDLDVVYVSVNYRLGALGWLDLRAHGTADHRIEANLGLRDQLAALEWVKRNIARFGGDPDRVTVMGESAGAASVLALLASPASDGLFARAISQSGLAAVPSPERSVQAGEQFVEALGGVDVLFGADTAPLVRATERLANTTQGLPFGPVIDDVLPIEPVAALRAGAGAGVPLLIGSNRDEGRFFQRLGEMLPTTGPLIDGLLGTEPAGDVVRRAYPGYARRKKVAARLGGDYVFWSSTLAAADAHAAAGAQVWMYRFDFAPPAMRLAGLGATHAMELPYVFGVRSLGHAKHATVLGGRRAASGVQKRMQRAWGQMVRTGTAPWPAFSTATRATWLFDATDHLTHDPDSLRRQAWEHFHDH